MYVRFLFPRFRTPLTIHPEVKYIPGWFPGAGFGRYAKENRRMFDAVVDGPLEHAKRSLKVSPSTPCECFDLLIDDGDKSERSKVSTL